MAKYCEQFELYRDFYSTRTDTEITTGHFKLPWRNSYNAHPKILMLVQSECGQSGKSITAWSNNPTEEESILTLNSVYSITTLEDRPEGWWLLTLTKTLVCNCSYVYTDNYSRQSSAYSFRHFSSRRHSPLNIHRSRSTAGAKNVQRSPLMNRWRQSIRPCVPHDKFPRWKRQEKSSRQKLTR